MAETPVRLPSTKQADVAANKAGVSIGRCPSCGEAAVVSPRDQYYQLPYEERAMSPYAPPDLDDPDRMIFNYFWGPALSCLALGAFYRPLAYVGPVVGAIWAYVHRSRIAARNRRKSRRWEAGLICENCETRFTDDADRLLDQAEFRAALFAPIGFAGRLLIYAAALVAYSFSGYLVAQLLDSAVLPFLPEWAAAIVLLLAGIAFIAGGFVVTARVWRLNSR